MKVRQPGLSSVFCSSAGSFSSLSGDCSSGKSLRTDRNTTSCRAWTTRLCQESPIMAWMGRQSNLIRWIRYPGRSRPIRDGIVTAGNVEEILSYLPNCRYCPRLRMKKTCRSGWMSRSNPLYSFYEDGSEYTLEFRQSVGAGCGYYALKNGQDIIVLPNGSIDQLGTLFDSIIHPPTPTPEFTETPSASLEPQQLQRHDQCRHYSC